MKHSKEFKDSTVQLILNNNESTVKVATDLGLNPNTLYNWISMYRKEHNMPVKDVKQIIKQKHCMKRINS